MYKLSKIVPSNRTHENSCTDGTLCIKVNYITINYIRHHVQISIFFSVLCVVFDIYTYCNYKNVLKIK